jgi:inosose dehydratase
MSIRFGVSPIAWINDDMPELGAGTALSSVLADARDIGFLGVEMGGTFPREPVALRAVLGAYNLDLVGGWFGGGLLAHDARTEIAGAREHVALLHAMGCKVFIIAETSNAIHGARATPLSAGPRLSDETWPVFGERLTAFADFIDEEGLRLAYHPHLGTVVERPADVEALLRHTGEEVGLTLDTGHAALAGVDAIGLIRAHPGRIAHVHCKDIRGEVFARGEATGMSFLEGVLAGMFTAPGDGDLDWDALMGALADAGYEGWVVVEAEQDPAKADPKTYAALGLATLEAAAAARGVAIDRRRR